MNMSSNDHTRTLVFFDLETTGLGTSSCEIVQIAAISGQQSFNRYILPQRPMDDEASKVTGFHVESRTLYYKEEPLSTVPLREALESFISYLKTFNKPLLVGHNCMKFDCPILGRVLKELCLVDKFHKVVFGFLDTWRLSKKLLNLERYTQEFLFNHFCHRSYNAHNAMDDVRALQELYHAWEPCAETVNSLITFVPI